MAYNKTSEERKWNYWKEQEEKKLRELGMEEEKIQKLRQMDREDFLEERRYREHLDETMQDMDSIKEKDSELFARDVKELLDHIGDKRIYAQGKAGGVLFRLYTGKPHGIIHAGSVYSGDKQQFCSGIGKENDD